MLMMVWGLLVLMILLCIAVAVAIAFGLIHSVNYLLERRLQPALHCHGASNHIVHLTRDSIAQWMRNVTVTLLLILVTHPVRNIYVWQFLTRKNQKTHHERRKNC